MKKPHNAAALFQKYLDGTASAEEIAIIESWQANYPLAGRSKADPDQMAADLAEIRTELVTLSTPARQRKLWPRIAAAASIILISSVTYTLLTQKQPAVQITATHGEELAPMNKGVVLTMANGKKMTLANGRNGDLETADGTKLKQSGEELSYTEEANGADNTVNPTHTLTNNTGNKYSLVLADGTEAHLDARSTITYPVNFTGKERKVSVTGQVYFKVKHNPLRPFLVTVKEQTIEDIGTEFNINSYSSETVTTLVSGSVRLRSGTKVAPIVLKPGEQAVLSQNSFKARTADLEETTAWLQGRIVFHHEPLESILNNVARIYDVKIVWLDNDLKKIAVNGSVNRTKKLAAVLNFFRKTGEVDFLVEGKTVKVFKYKK